MVRSGTTRSLRVCLAISPRFVVLFSSSHASPTHNAQVNEGRKIMHHPSFRASVTCVRVPVYRAHSVAVSAEFESPISLSEAKVKG
jgi:aspartate-semialdehyde dehydrogenase